MKETLRVINQMQADGVIGKYAIGGAIAATLYLEPAATFDLDIFTSFKPEPGRLIVSPARIYEYLERRGYQPKNEFVHIEGWDVQFLPADDELYGEAVSEAVEAEVLEIKTWVMRPEHLMAIALKTGRAKDFIRLEQFVRTKAYDAVKLNEILAQQGLLAKWREFNETYLR